MKNNKPNKKKKGSLLMMLGILFMAAALALSIYNYIDGRRAYEAATDVVEKLKDRIDKQADDPSYDDPFGNKAMPTIEIDGYRYIGVLEIPSKNISLPVMEEWDYDRLKISPCRYSGSYYTDDLVIAGHNYARHFSPIKWIELKSDVYFINVEGKVYHYKVDNVETLKPTQVKEMKRGDWDLTLFTCNTGGYTRCTVRCVRVEE